MTLAHQAAVITGAGAGIGRACAIAIRFGPAFGSLFDGILRHDPSRASMHTVDQTTPTNMPSQGRCR